MFWIKWEMEICSSLNLSQFLNASHLAVIRHIFKITAGGLSTNQLFSIY